jgi:hypothetical protein
MPARRRICCFSNPGKQTQFFQLLQYCAQARSAAPIRAWLLQFAPNSGAANAPTRQAGARAA